MVARRYRLFVDNVNTTIALNSFARRRLIMAGFTPERVVMLPNMVDIPTCQADPGHGTYMIFSGRMCPEKGVSTLLAAARQTPDIEIRLLGDGPTCALYRDSAPPNAKFLGQLPQDLVFEQYRGAKCVVVPSQLFEGCPLVILEAMSHGLPVIASRIGGLPELVEDGSNGLLFEPGDASELAAKMRFLWSEPEVATKMGRAGRTKARLDHSPSVFWARLEKIYEALIQDRPGVSA
jgi:glycosyltransferase involved in cell wall biosynthesis